MCGIMGYNGKQNAIPIVIKGLKSLEYRGYDSAGIAYLKDENVKIIKEKGRITELEKLLDDDSSNTAIGHTRWATHGSPNRINAHPHKVGKITLVHNGIMENYAKVKEDLKKEGYEFKSQTDTEVLCALIDKLYNETHDMLKAIAKMTKEVIGSYGLVIMCDERFKIKISDTA